LIELDRGGDSKGPSAEYIMLSSLFPSLPSSLLLLSLSLLLLLMALGTFENIESLVLRRLMLRLLCNLARPAVRVAGRTVSAKLWRVPQDPEKAFPSILTASKDLQLSAKNGYWSMAY
jgi:hypothetical protein